MGNCHPDKTLQADLDPAEVSIGNMRPRVSRSGDTDRQQAAEDHLREWQEHHRQTVKDENLTEWGRTIDDPLVKMIAGVMPTGLTGSVGSSAGTSVAGIDIQQFTFGAHQQASSPPGSAFSQRRPSDAEKEDFPEGRQPPVTSGHDSIVSPKETEEDDDEPPEPAPWPAQPQRQHRAEHALQRPGRLTDRVAPTRKPERLAARPDPPASAPPRVMVPTPDPEEPFDIGGGRVTFANVMEAKLKAKEWQFQLKMEAKMVDREIKNAKKEESKLMKQITETAASGQAAKVEQLARSIVTCRKTASRLESARASMTAVDMKLSQAVVAATMKHSLQVSADVMHEMNSIARIQDVAPTMEAMRREMAQCADAEAEVEEALRDEDDDEEVRQEVQRILDEVELEKVKILVAAGSGPSLHGTSVSSSLPPNRASRPANRSGVSSNTA